MGTEGDARPELRELIHYLDSGIVNGRYSHTLDSAVQSVKLSEGRHEYIHPSGVEHRTKQSIFFYKTGKTCPGLLQRNNKLTFTILCLAIQ